MSKTVPLGDLTILLRRGISPNYVESSGVVVLNQKCIRENSVDFEQARLTDVNKNIPLEKMLQVGDILVNSTGTGTVGRTATFKAVNFPVTADSHITIVRPSKEINAGYLGYYLANIEPVIESLAKGATNQVELSSTSLAELPIPIPPVVTQEKISNILSLYDMQMANNRRRIKLLEDAARLLYREWFVHFRFPGHEHVKITNGLPAGWLKKPLSALCQDIREQIEPASIEPETPYIGLEHMPRRSITLCDWGMASDVTSSKFKFLAKDILFGKIRPYFHKVGFAITDGITSSDAIVIRPIHVRSYEYLLLLLSTDEFVALASKTVREGSKMPRADWKFLARQQFVMPSDKILSFFSETVNPMLSQLKVLAIQNKQLTQARDILLPRLMNGEIKV